MANIIPFDHVHPRRPVLHLMQATPLISRAVLLLALVSGAGLPALAQLPTTPNLAATAIETPAGPQFSIVFSDLGTGATNYLLERTPTVGDDALWTVDTNATITALGGGQFRATTLRPLVFGAYRIVAYNAGAALSAQFASPTVSLEEGSGGYHLIVLFSQPFTGTLHYTVNGPAGTLIQPPSGSVTVTNATTARIPILLGDDLTISEMTFLALTLQAGSGVAPGANSQVLVTIRDNDSVWDGGFVSDGIELIFKYRQARNGAAYQAMLVSDGSGLIPVGAYPAQLGLAGQPFPAVVSLALPTSASALNLPATLSLQLVVQPGLGDHRLTDGLARGSATLAITYAGQPHLNSTRTGRFLLQRPPPPPSPAEVELATTP
jgi:hypothetical protein